MSSEKIAILNCSLDLQRAAKFYFLDPAGSTFRIFFNHALRILSSINNSGARRYTILLNEMGSKLESGVSILEREGLADKMLTAGLMLKGIT